MGSWRNCTWILGLSGFRVMRIAGEEETHSRLQIHVERRGRCYPCGGCGRCTARVRSSKERTWDDQAVLRRARGMKDEDMLLLKLKWATARPIRSARDLARFLNV